jgi:HicB_like antitoxin of bacterial toxin-antitoxin system
VLGIDHLAGTKNLRSAHHARGLSWQVLPMPILAVGNTVYPADVAKVLISIPDDLLSRIDEFAKRSAETRSGFLQRLAEREIAADNARRKKEFEELLGPPLRLGGNAAQKIKESHETGKPWH